MRVLPTPSQSRAKPQNGCSPASDTLRMEHDSSIPGRVGAAGLVQCPLGCSCPPGPGRPRSTDGLPRVLRAVGRRCPAGRSHRLQLDCRDVGDGWAAPDDRSILHEDANRCLPSSPYCLVTRRATRIPGEHQVALPPIPARSRCARARCRTPTAAPWAATLPGMPAPWPTLRCGRHRRRGAVTARSLPTRWAGGRLRRVCSSGERCRVHHSGNR
jgi:hypothetical protein